MLSDLTTEEFTALQIALELYQRSGAAPQPGEMSYAELAAWFMTTPADIRNVELATLEKIRNHLHV